MQLDDFELGRTEGPWLVQHVVGDGQLSDVVQQGTALNGLQHVVVGHAEGLGQGDGVTLDPADVAVSDLVLDINGDGEHLNGRVIPVFDLLQVLIRLVDPRRRLVEGHVRQDHQRDDQADRGPVQPGAISRDEHGGQLRAVLIGRGRKRVYRIHVREALRYARSLGLL